MKKIKEFFKKPKRVLLDIPNTEIIECEIETPQFHGSQEKFTMYKQRGKFYKSDMKFLHSGVWCGHDVQFHSMEDFQRALLRIF